MTSTEIYAAGYALPMMGVTRTTRPFRHEDKWYRVPINADIAMKDIDTSVGVVRAALLADVQKVAL